MKKIFLSLTLLLFAIAGFGQAFKPLKVDSLVTVSIPAQYQKKDTLGQHIYSANTMYGYISVIVAPNDKNNTPLNKESDLNAVLKKYIKSIQGQSGDGSAQHVRDTTVGTLKAKVFTLKSEDASGNVGLINFILVYTQEATYTFEYVYPEMRKDLVNAEYKEFSSSIRLSRNLQRNDQYLSSSKGLSVTQIAIFGGGALLIVIVVVSILRRKRGLSVS